MECEYRLSDAGIDWTDVDRPRTGWVFQVPYHETQWEEPEEAKAIWGRRFINIDLDLITLDHVENVSCTWERRRDGKLLLRSPKTYDAPLPIAKSLAITSFERFLLAVTEWTNCTSDVSSDYKLES